MILRKVPSVEEHIDDGVEAWLDHASDQDIYDDLNDMKEPEGGASPFHVWPDTKEAAVRSSNLIDQSSPHKALKDVSTLRKPGYSEKNSFFKDDSKATEAVQGFTPGPSGAKDFDRTLAILEGRLKDRRAPSLVRMEDIEMGFLGRRGRR